MPSQRAVRRAEVPYSGDYAPDDEADKPGQDEGGAGGKQTALGRRVGRSVTAQVEDEGPETDGDKPDGGRVDAEADADGEPGYDPDSPESRCTRAGVPLRSFLGLLPYLERPPTAPTVGFVYDSRGLTGQTGKRRHKGLLVSGPSPENDQLQGCVAGVAKPMVYSGRHQNSVSSDHGHVLAVRPHSPRPAESSRPPPEGHRPRECDYPHWLPVPAPTLGT